MEWLKLFAAKVNNTLRLRKLTKRYSFADFLNDVKAA